MHVAVVSTAPTAAHARLTVRHAARHTDAGVSVLDVDGSYAAVSWESVLRPADVDLGQDALHLAAAALEPVALCSHLTPVLTRHLLTAHDTVLALAAGTVLTGPLAPWAARLAPQGATLVARAPRHMPSDGRHPTDADLAAHGGYAPGLVVIGGSGAGDVLDRWQHATDGMSGAGPHWADVTAAAMGPAVVRDAAALVSWWSVAPGQCYSLAAGESLRLDGEPVLALDATGLDPAEPWFLDATRPGDPRARLSDHPDLAQLVAGLAAELRDDARAVGVRTGSPDLTQTSFGTPWTPALRSLMRAASSSADWIDPFDPHRVPDLLEWLTAPPDGGRLGRYVAAVRDERADLRETFPATRAGDDGLMEWVRTHAVEEGHPEVVVAESVRRYAPPAPHRGRPTPGVNVVGFLRGELGIGESARQLVRALDAAGVPVAVRSTEVGSASRHDSAPTAPSTVAATYDTTVICVNADLSQAVATAFPELLDRSYRIGMWYWEVEDFPPSQYGGFAPLDEVWVATDFVRRAVERHSPVPVRTLTPPLPQRVGPVRLTRADLGWPSDPVFLFAFDFLSTAERKNPWGAVDAFTRAFGPNDGPVLVVKSINADKRPVEAERLRLHVARHPHVRLDERYLAANERDALMALADCYVSLHRSEGLGLTMAEAMAWGKPVVATAYSGNLQFMTDENSFLVPWTPTTIPAGAAPYPAGSIWADPDLDAAAAVLRLVVDDPDLAAERGGRAAADIATLHSPEAAGRRIAARLAELEPRRRARTRLSPRTALENMARRTRRPR